MNGFFEKGYAILPKEEPVLHWTQWAYEAALPSVNDPVQQEAGLECEGTWFVGVDALPNDALGAVMGGHALAGQAFSFLSQTYGELPLHKAQVSVVYEGYPRPRKGETERAFHYRKTRDAAHVDGLLPQGAKRRRYLLETHAYILGLPLNDAPATASPLVVWEGSHLIMKEVFNKALSGLAPDEWIHKDITDIYVAARKRVFETCPRIELPAKPGEATMIHRHALHGVAPWQSSRQEGRMIAYFRPEFPAGATDWLTAP